MLLDGATAVATAASTAVAAAAAAAAAAASPIAEHGRDSGIRSSLVRLPAAAPDPSAWSVTLSPELPHGGPPTPAPSTTSLGGTACAVDSAQCDTRPATDDGADSSSLGSDYLGGSTSDSTPAATVPLHHLLLPFTPLPTPPLPLVTPNSAPRKPSSRPSLSCHHPPPMPLTQALRLVQESFAADKPAASPPESKHRPPRKQAPAPAAPASKPTMSGRKRAASGATEEPQRYKKRPYGHSCLACRERKIKCEEVETPPCRGCRETNTVCEPVERVRVPRQTKDTDAVLAEFDKRIRRLEALADGNGGQSLSAAAAAAAAADTKPQIQHTPQTTVPTPTTHKQRVEITTPSVRRGGNSTVTAGSAAPPEELNEVTTQGQSSDGQDGDGEQVEDALGRPQYHLGSAARPVYHGELSMFDDSGTRQTAPASPRFDSTSPTNWTEERLRAAARLRHRYATADEAEQWLDTYFSWASPVYAVVHRPLFIRDMALDGPYFSEFLLIVMYISGIRFSAGLTERERAQRGEQYVSLAMSMLAEETMAPGKIPTIQALLGLAGRQGAVGKTNQAWMLTGMAIRMMQDMGLHLPVDQQDGATNKFSPEEREMRNRLFWSAYCWDKTMSLTLGREPSLASRPGFTPDSLPEDPDDDTDWSPCLPPDVLQLDRPYPKRKLLKTFTLRHSAKLNVILESILTNMYSPSRPNARSLSFIRSAIDRLDGWRKQLPDEIKIEAHSLPAVSPPANTVILNLLYHTIRILIYRPLLTSANTQSALASSALTHCRNASAETGAVLSLWGQTFGHFNHHFLFVYCCFISAGVDILLIRTGNPFVRDEAFQRVHVSLDILEQASAQGPGIRRGITNIRAQLDRATTGQISFPKEPAFDVETHRPSPAPDAGHMSLGTVDEAHSTAHAHAAQAQQDMQWFSDGDLWDHQTLLDILSAAPISTEDPFAFTDASLVPF